MMSRCPDCGCNFPEGELNGHQCYKTDVCTAGGYSYGSINNFGPVTTAVGTKHDQSKPDLSLLPREFLEEVARSMMYGEKKYGRDNYKSGMDWHRVTAALLRHATAFNSGEDNDAESGLSHLSHAGACVLMLLYYYKNKVGKDTRFKGVP
jgi:hypothetical protein